MKTARHLLQLTMSLFAVRERIWGSSGESAVEPETLFQDPLI